MTIYDKKDFTNENDMIVQLSFVFAFPIEFCHLFKRVEHRLYDLLIRLIDGPADLEAVRTNELILHASNIHREELDELHDASPFLAVQFGQLDSLYLLILCVTSKRCG